MYLQRLAARGLRPAVVVLFLPEGESPESAAADNLPADVRGAYERELGIDTSADLAGLLAALGVPTETVRAATVNSPAVAAAVARLPTATVLFSGPPGAIARERLFATGKRFLHAHPGRLPDYRGSTTMYYSLLAEDACAVTAFFLEREVDTGRPLRIRAFPPPRRREAMDLQYDPWMRAETVADYLESGPDPRLAAEAAAAAPPQRPYFIIHPVLKHVAILAGDPHG